MSRQFNFKRLEEAFEADWPVEVSIPQDGGTVAKETFTARFRMLTSDETDAIFAGDTDGTGAKRQAQAYFVGFGKGTDETLTPELFDQLWTTPYVRLGIIRAYTNFTAGIAVKN